MSYFFFKVQKLVFYYMYDVVAILQLFYKLKKKMKCCVQFGQFAAHTKLGFFYLFTIFHAPFCLFNLVCAALYMQPLCSRTKLLQSTQNRFLIGKNICYVTVVRNNNKQQRKLEDIWQQLKFKLNAQAKLQIFIINELTGASFY